MCEQSSYLFSSYFVNVIMWKNAFVSQSVATLPLFDLLVVSLCSYHHVTAVISRSHQCHSSD